MLVKAALNGARDPVEHQAIPVTPQELAREARAAVAAGAGALHLHVRDAAGVESLAAADVAAALAAVRSACPGTPVGISSGEWIVPDPELRCARAAEWTTLPDFVSINFHERGAVQLARLLLERGIAVEAGLDSSSAAETMTASPVAGSCLRVLLEPAGSSAGVALQTVAEIERLLDAAGVEAPRRLHGSGEIAWKLVAEAARRGYDTRIGFEDTLALPDGRLAAGNGELVAAARRIVAEAQRGIAGRET